jgi:hypothetical protein
MDRELRKRQAARQAIALLGRAYLVHRARIDGEIAFELMISAMRRTAAEVWKPRARLSVVMMREDDHLPAVSRAAHYS